MGIKLKLTGLRRFVRTEAEIADYTAQVAAAQDTLVNGTGAGNDFLGWLNLPVDYDRDEFARIKQAAKKIQQTCDVLIVIGIGGSYLGARAAIVRKRSVLQPDPPGGHSGGVLCRQQHFVVLLKRHYQDDR